MYNPIPFKWKVTPSSEGYRIIDYRILIIFNINIIINSVVLTRIIFAVEASYFKSYYSKIPTTRKRSNIRHEMVFIKLVNCRWNKIHLLQKPKPYVMNSKWISSCGDASLRWTNVIALYLQKWVFSVGILYQKNKNKNCVNAITAT